MPPKRSLRHPLSGDPPGATLTTAAPRAATRNKDRPSATVLAAFARLTERDLLLADWLDRHGVLTTSQITSALFGQPDTAATGWLQLAPVRPWTGSTGRYPAAGRPPGTGSRRARRPTGGHRPREPRPYRAADAPAARQAGRQPAAGPPARRQQLLHRPARPRPHHPDTRTAALVVRTRHRRPLRRAASTPTGTPCGSTSTAVVGLFLEHDTGSEDLPRLMRKLGAYEYLAADGGPGYPVLFWMHSARREDNLHTALATHRVHRPVHRATAVRGPGVDPADPVWRMPGHIGRYALHQLPCDHGEPDSLYAPNLRDRAPTRFRRLISNTNAQPAADGGAVRRRRFSLEVLIESLSTRARPPAADCVGAAEPTRHLRPAVSATSTAAPRPPARQPPSRPTRDPPAVLSAAAPLPPDHTRSPSTRYGPAGRVTTGGDCTRAHSGDLARQSDCSSPVQQAYRGAGIALPNHRAAGPRRAAVPGVVRPDVLRSSPARKAGPGRSTARWPLPQPRATRIGTTNRRRSQDQPARVVARPTGSHPAGSSVPGSSWR